MILLSKLFKITPDILLNLCSEVVNLIQVKMCPHAQDEAVWERGTVALQFPYSALYQDDHVHSQVPFYSCRKDLDTYSTEG